MRLTPYLAALLCVTWLFVCGTAWSADVEEEAGTKPPHGELHIRSHRVAVVLNNGFATTEVNQVLVKPQTQDVEAEWDFPLPKEGSLSELAISIGEDLVVGEVVEKKKATQIFEAEKSATICITWPRPPCCSCMRFMPSSIVSWSMKGSGMAKPMR